MLIKNFLETLNGPKIVSLKTKTQVRMLVASKEVFPMGVTKISVRNGIIGTDYSSVVNNKIFAEENPQTQEEAEAIPHFEAEALWKGKGKNVTKFICVHTEKNTEYLKFLPKMIGEKNVTKNIYIDNATGKNVEESEVNKFMGAKSNSPYGVNWQVVELCNVLGINEVSFEE